MQDIPLAIAELVKFEVTCHYYLRLIKREKDSDAARLFMEKLDALSAESRGIIKHIRLGENWEHYCRCGFKRPPKVAGRMQCPKCGEGLRVRSLD